MSASSLLCTIPKAIGCPTWPSRARHSGITADIIARMWIYHQVNGDFFKDLQWIARGYSGFEAGKNNPASQTVHDVCPIPQGNWSSGPPHATPEHGPHVMPLTPDAATRTLR